MKRIMAVIVIVIFILISIKIIIYDNVTFLCMIAEGSNEPSAIYYFAIERVYKIAEKDNIGKNLVEAIKENKDSNLHRLYIRILGVIGEETALPHLMGVYMDHQHDVKSTRVFTIVKSLGPLGKEEVVPFLEHILNDEDKWIALSQPAAQSLYLLTGKQYNFINTRGEKQKLFLYDELKQAREVILDTKTRKRRFSDMLILDKVFRPPEKD